MTATTTLNRRPDAPGLLGVNARKALDLIGEAESGQVTARLAHELRSAVESHFRRFDKGAVREFAPVLVERRIRAELRALARV
jgi:hypothetical protein